MNDSQNPFEAAMTQTGGNAPNPFTQPASTPAVNLGSEGAAQNPFDAPAQIQTAIPAVAPAPQPQPPVIPTAAPVQMPATAATLPQMPYESDETGQTQLPFGMTGQAPSDLNDTGEPVNPIAAALEQQGAESQTSIFVKLPVFEHGSVKEEIEDVTQTFDDLRVAKAEDFPELEDANRVSWEVSYGKIRKTVFGTDAKKKKIGEFKATIETSKEFIEALKKSKEKTPVCTVKPRVTAQSKGERIPEYKGVFTNLDEAETSGKAICIVPGRDGNVYEIRRDGSGTFIMPTDWCKELSEVKAGFTPALPLIPRTLLVRVITFFRSLLYTDAGGSFEAIANILWDKEREEFIVCVPKQTVSATRADSDLTLSDEWDNDRFLHYMDIHSHNLMSAKFSQRDDRDEKATRLFAVIGRLDRYLPEISVRMGCGGRHMSLDPSEVFEPIWEEYPEEWHNQLTFSGTVPKPKCDEDYTNELAFAHELEDYPHETDKRFFRFWRKGLYGEAA